MLVAHKLAIPPTASAGEAAEQARAGFESLFRQHFPAVRRWVRALGVRATDVDDVAQEVFVIAHRRLDQLRQGSSATGWLFSITRRTCANHRRGRVREEARRQHADGPTAMPDPEDAVGRREAASILQGFLDGLPDEQRDAFVLYEIEGMKAPEVAEALGVAADSVHSRVRLARDKLARVVARHRARIEGERDG